VYLAAAAISAWCAVWSTAIKISFIGIDHAIETSGGPAYIGPTNTRRTLPAARTWRIGCTSNAITPNVDVRHRFERILWAHREII